MKLNSVTRFIVVSCTILGTVVVATSQPGMEAVQQGGNWPEHSMIPDNVSLAQVAEFHDAATLHLNDMQKNITGSGGAGPQMRGKKTKFNETTILHTKAFLSAVDDTLVRYQKWETSARPVGPSSGPMVKLSAAEVAVLYYVFDEGVHHLRDTTTGQATGKAGTAKVKPPFANAGPDGISAKISAEDMGMTSAQLKQMVAQYCESHPMRFWNQARVGLASMK